jgi:hypothetical protein
MPNYVNISGQKMIDFNSPKIQPPWKKNGISKEHHDW